MSQHKLALFKEARKRWGTAKARPHDTIPGYLEWRKTINQKASLNKHPHSTEIENWSVSVNMLIHSSLHQPRKVHFIDTEEKLQKMISDFQWFNEFMVDTEMNSDTYFPIICLIQISNFENEYVIDALCLFDKIKQYLGPFFEDATKLKVFHGDADIVPLQQNFEIFTIGMIDSQEAYTLIDSTKDHIAFADMVDNLLGIKLDKVGQRADWTIRPLHPDMLDYASKDTRFLFESWLKIKDSCTFFEHEPFSRSKVSCLRTSKLHLTRTVTSAWQSYMGKLSHEQKGLFSSAQQKSLFSDIYIWRDKLAREIDFHPHKLINPGQLQFITRAMPTSLKYLKVPQMISAQAQLTDKRLEEILELIRHHRSFMFLKTVDNTAPLEVTTQIKTTDNTNKVTDSDSMDMTFTIENKPMEQVTETESSITPVSDQTPPTTSVSISLDSMHTTALSSSKNAQKQRRYRANLKSRGIKPKRKSSKIKRNSSIAKRTAAFLRTALRYNLTQTQIVEHIHKIPKSLRK